MAPHGTFSRVDCGIGVAWQRSVPRRPWPFAWLRLTILAYLFPLVKRHRVRLVYLRGWSKLALLMQSGLRLLTVSPWRGHQWSGATLRKTWHREAVKRECPPSQDANTRKRSAEFAVFEVCSFSSPESSKAADFLGSKTLRYQLPEINRRYLKRSPGR